MVKGLSRKIIVVKSPDPKIFEQAIFIVREDYLTTQGINQKELMRQARRAASGYVDRNYGWKRFKPLKLLACGLLVAAVLGLALGIGCGLF